MRDPDGKSAIKINPTLIPQIQKRQVLCRGTKHLSLSMCFSGASKGEKQLSCA